VYDFAYARALEAIAMGETLPRTRDYLVDENGLGAETFKRAATDALRDALRQGVEREDIDPSWRLL